MLRLQRTEPAPLTVDVLRYAGARVYLWWQRARQRRALARLEPAQLDDIGVSAAQARRESSKPFWRA